MSAAPDKPKWEGEMTAAVIDEEQYPRMLLESCKYSFGSFYRIFSPAEKLVIGRHTAKMIETLDVAYVDYEAGISSYLITNIAFRHGKSEISELFAAWFLLRNPRSDVIIAGYNDEFVNGELSIKARDVFEKACPLFGLRPDKSKWSLGRWGAAGYLGGVTAAGIRAGITGKGGALNILDDPYKSRKEAESEVVRSDVQNAFQSDLMTRRAPTSINIINMNRWHVSDICGWISNKNNPTHEIHDPNFPKFRVMKFPAVSPEYATAENPKGWLFPERYSDAWYESSKATMGGEKGYGWMSQAMQEPMSRFGNLWKIDGMKIVAESELPRGIRLHRGWDLASTEEERMKDDPDYTSGTLAGIHDGTIWVADNVSGRWEANKRDDIIYECALRDGPQVTVWIEGVAGYIDTYNRLRKRLDGKSVVRLITRSTDKVTKGEALENYFALGAVRMIEGEWNDRVSRNYGLFPTGDHDDDPDSLINAIDDELTKRMGQPIFVAERPDRLKMQLEPIIYKDRDGRWRRRFKGVKRYDDTDFRDAFEPAGSLCRVTYLGLREGSASIVIHIDKDRCWSVISCAMSKMGRPMADLAGEIIQNARTSDEKPIWHTYEEDYLTSDDNGEVVFAVEEAMHEASKKKNLDAGYPVPSWIEPTEIDGKAGIEIIENLVSASDKGNGNGIVVWPQVVLDALKEARFRPQRPGREGMEGKEVVDVNPIIRAVKILAVKRRW